MLQMLVPLVALTLGAAQDAKAQEAKAQDAKLEIDQPHATYGFLGARRPPGEGALPGDVLHFTFNIKHLKHDAKGRVNYSVGVEVLDDNGEVMFRQQPRNITAIDYFGGDTIPFSSSLEIPTTAKPGAMSWAVTVKDRMTDGSLTVKGKGKVRPADFGLVQVGTFADREGRVPMPPVGVVGSQLNLHFATVGFERDPSSKQPNIKVALRVLDENKKATFPEPLEGHVHENVPSDVQVVPMQFGLSMNRPGRFTLELTARDEVSGKTDRLLLPVRVLEAD